MKWQRALALSSLCLLMGACTAFPSIPSGECGNGVVDPDEDCDTFAASGLLCRPKGSDDACHLDCSLRGGQRRPCPSGWGCDSSFVCRAPSAGFDEPSAAVDVGAWTLSAADFDGDQRTDIMSSEPLDSLGETRLRFFYFDQQGALADTRPFLKLLLSPVIKDVSGDGLPDVAFSDGGSLGVMLGRANRSWVPETFSSYQNLGTAVRIVPVYDIDIEHATPFITLIGASDSQGRPAGANFYVIDPLTSLPDERARVANSLEELVADPVSGNVFEDRTKSPCYEPVLAVRGAKHFTIVDTCDTDQHGVVVWKPRFEQQDIALDPPAAIDAAPLIVDLNGDGHLDVLVGAGGRAYVSYGDGSKLGGAIPYVLWNAPGGGFFSDIPMPLAVGDLTHDGAPDFVFADQLWFSSSAGGGALPQYSVRYNHWGSAWTAARFADLNRDGLVDLVTASNAAPNAQFYDGTGAANFSETLISTAAAQFLATGDFDGDGTTDLAIAEVTRFGQSRGSLKIAFGVPFSAPSVPVTVAQLAGPEAVVALVAQKIANLVIASKEPIHGKLAGALTFLGGSRDRLPFASLSLNEFVLSSKVENSAAIAVAAGDFSAKDSTGDLLALAFPLPATSESPAPPVQPWLLRSVETPGANAKRLADSLNAQLSPLVFLPMGVGFTADVASTAADLNGDGLDEAIFAMPASAGRGQCAVLSFGAVGSGPAVEAREPVLLDEPCTDPQIVAVDADADGALDLALLTGQTGSNHRKLYVLWNDSGFSSANVTLVSADVDSPQAFTPLPGTPGTRNSMDAPEAPGRPFGFVYVTQDQALFAGAADERRQFSAPRSLLDNLTGGTGVAAADVNGDRVTDVVIAESGNLRVLKARLKLP